MLLLLLRRRLSLLSGGYNYDSTSTTLKLDRHSTAVPPPYEYSTTYVTLRPYAYLLWAAACTVAGVTKWVIAAGRLRYCDLTDL